MGATLSAPPGEPTFAELRRRDREKKAADAEGMAQLLRRRAAEPPLMVPGEEVTSMVDFARTAERVAKNGAPPAEKVSVRLERKFKLGANPKQRRSLYQRLDLVVAHHGQEAIDVIGEVVADAVGKDKPDRWFCKAVLGRLRDRKLLANVETGDPSW